MRGCWIAAAIFALAYLVPPGARAEGDEIWSAVVLATREDPPKPPPKKIASLAPDLSEIFGYNTFYLIGQKETGLYEGQEKWLLPSRRIFLKTEILSREAARYVARIDLYDGETLLVSTEAKLAREAPLFIRGPGWGKGQLIAIVGVK